MLKFSELAAQFRVDNPQSFRLKDGDADDTWKIKDKEKGAEYLEGTRKRLAELQDRLYAQDRWSLLLVFQAMDAAGKDGTIKHVMSGVNPQGCQVFSFKSPSAEELDHDFLWRTNKCLPERGRIGIFNRSYYEEVLVIRVHPQLLDKQKLPAEVVTKKIWQERYEDIRNYEQYLSRNGTVVRKFFLQVSHDEQKRRFLSRLDEKEKNWKFSATDARERQHWDAYQKAYEDAIAATSTKHSPWFVVPADHKWFTRIVVAAAIIDTLEGLHLEYPKVDAEKKKELAQSKAILDGEKK
jgi:PPK2 family polyphosphate:nucleotide phosphotransferase